MEASFLIKPLALMAVIVTAGLVGTFGYLVGGQAQPVWVLLVLVGAIIYTYVSVQLFGFLGRGQPENIHDLPDGEYVTLKYQGAHTGQGEDRWQVYNFVTQEKYGFRPRLIRYNKPLPATFIIKEGKLPLPEEERQPRLAV